MVDIVWCRRAPANPMFHHHICICDGGRQQCACLVVDYEGHGDKGCNDRELYRMCHLEVSF